MGRTGFLLMLSAIISAAASVPGVHGQVPPQTTLRVVTVTRQGTPWNDALELWDRELRRETHGQVAIEVIAGTPAMEPQIVAALQNHEIDGGSLTSVGMGALVPRALVLQAPGVCLDYAHCDSVHAAMDGPLEAEFTRVGLELMAWTDYGTVHVFSNRPITRPTDLQQAHTWALINDLLLPELLDVVGAPCVIAPMEAVRTLLIRNSIDTVFASAFMVRAMGWDGHLHYVSNTSHGVIMGGIVFDRQSLDALPPHLRTSVELTSTHARAALRSIRTTEGADFLDLIRLGVLTLTDVARHRARWEEAAAAARARLVGRHFSQDDLDRAVAASSRLD